MMIDELNRSLRAMGYRPLPQNETLVLWLWGLYLLLCAIVAIFTGALFQDWVEDQRISTTFHLSIAVSIMDMFYVALVWMEWWQREDLEEWYAFALSELKSVTFYYVIVLSLFAFAVQVGSPLFKLFLIASCMMVIAMLVIILPACAEKRHLP